MGTKATRIGKASEALFTEVIDGAPWTYRVFVGQPNGASIPLGVITWSPADKAYLHAGEVMGTTKDAAARTLRLKEGVEAPAQPEIATEPVRMVQMKDGSWEPIVRKAKGCNPGVSAADLEACNA